MRESAFAERLYKHFLRDKGGDERPLPSNLVRIRQARSSVWIWLSHLQSERYQQLRVVLREQKMLMGYLPRVIYHQEYYYTKLILSKLFPYRSGVGTWARLESIDARKHLEALPSGRYPPAQAAPLFTFSTIACFFTITSMISLQLPV